MQCDALVDSALSCATEWYESHRNQKGNVNTNVMTSGIAVADLLREHFPLTEDAIKSEKNSQVKGLSGSRIKKVLEQYGETRKFTSEGGRTSRGTLVLATEFALKLTESLIPFAPNNDELEIVANALQEHFVDCVRKDYFDKKTIEVDIDCLKPVSAIVGDILDAARSRADQPTGTVAQHLVGAKLELRFSNMRIGRDKANAADLQTDRQGDFQLGSTAFHVTVAPSAKLVDRARSNIQDGFRPLMLVPSSSVAFANGLFESEGLGERVGVQSIESFIGTNIEEMAVFDAGTIRKGVASLIRTYNARIEACENDQSLRIEEPAWMKGLESLSYGVVSL